MSEQTIRALKLIRDHPEIGSPQEFAKLMWPDSDRWHNHTKRGHGTSIGGGMAFAAGGYLGKLVHRGLLRVEYEGRGSWNRYWRLTDEGKKALESQGL